jgi:hypothetical protein
MAAPFGAAAGRDIMTAFTGCGARALLAVALLFFTAPAFAQSEAPAAPGAGDPAALPGTQAVPRRPRAIRFVGQLGYDIGFEKAIEVAFEGGEEQSLRTNGGLVFSVGAAFLPLFDGRFETRATAGVKYQTIQASNGHVSYLAFPLEIVEAVRLAPLRLSAGVSLSLAPRFSGSGVLSDADLDLDNSLGFLGVAEWVFPIARGRSDLSLGLRYLGQSFKLSGGGDSVSANAIGLFVGVTL